MEPPPAGRSIDMAPVRLVRPSARWKLLLGAVAPFANAGAATASASELQERRTGVLVGAVKPEAEQFDYVTRCSGRTFPLAWQNRRERPHQASGHGSTDVP